MNSESLEALKRRFSHRLCTALDSGGYPAQRTQRANAFGAAVRMDSHLVEQLLSGQRMPDFEQLMALCQRLQLQPGFFLDEHTPELPAATTLVRPLLAGEDLALCLPGDVMDARELREGLVYWRARVPMGFGIAAGDYLIALPSGTSGEPRPRDLYLFLDEDAVAVRECSEVATHRAVFRTDDEDGVPMIVRTGGGGAQAPAYSRLVARLRCGANLLLRQ